MFKLYKFLIFLCIPLLVYSSTQGNTYFSELENLNSKQKYILYYAYFTGLEKDLGLTLAAIAWKESHFGKYMLNITDGKFGSYGPYHILLEYAIARHNIKTNWEKSRLAEKLISNIDFTTKEALDILLYWDKRFKNKKNKWRWTIAAYNAGNASLSSTSGQKYADDIALRVKVLKRYFIKHKILVDDIKNDYALK